MAKKSKSVKSKLGLAPGSLIFTGIQKTNNVKIELVIYDEQDLKTVKLDDISKINKYLENKKSSLWINIIGLHDEKVIEHFGSSLSISKLVMEDILNVNHRPKLEEYQNYLFVIFRNLFFDNDSVADEQVSFVLSENVLISFQEQESPIFSHVLNRLVNRSGNIRKRGAGYLLYALIDSIVDYQSSIIDALNDKVEHLESSIIQNQEDSDLNRIHALRKEILFVRRAVYPVRDIIYKLEKSEQPAISEETKAFIRDLYDHSIQIIDNIDVLRDVISTVLELYMNNVSNKMNNVMKVLTIIATIFIPLTFVAGIYGMNFEYMPELSYKYAYFIIWILMIALAIVMIFFFKKRKWF